MMGDNMPGQMRLRWRIGSNLPLVHRSRYLIRLCLLVLAGTTLIPLNIELAWAHYTLSDFQDRKRWACEIGPCVNTDTQQSVHHINSIAVALRPVGMCSQVIRNFRNYTKNNLGSIGCCQLHFGRDGPILLTPYSLYKQSQLLVHNPGIQSFCDWHSRRKELRVY